MYETFKKGNTALYEIMLDLHKKDCEVFLPVAEQGPIDLITLCQNKIYKLQAKFSARKNSTSFFVSNRSGFYRKEKSIRSYQKEEFDFYAIFNPELNKVLYCPFDMGGKSISITLPKNNTSFYWYEDFLTFPPVNEIKMKSLNDFVEHYQDFLKIETKTKHLKNICQCGSPIYKKSKSCSVCFSLKLTETNKSKLQIEKKELQKLLWEKPTSSIAKLVNLSDNAVAKQCRKLGCSKPPRGYWTMSTEDKNKIRALNNIELLPLL